MLISFYSIFFTGCIFFLHNTFFHLLLLLIFFSISTSMSLSLSLFLFSVYATHSSCLCPANSLSHSLPISFSLALTVVDYRFLIPFFSLAQLAISSGISVSLFFSVYVTHTSSLCPANSLTFSPPLYHDLCYSFPLCFSLTLSHTLVIFILLHSSLPSTTAPNFHLSTSLRL